MDKKNPLSEDRDRFILSKGHGCLAYYSALSEVGYINKEQLKSFEKNDSDLLGHPVINKDLGIDFSNGSLGMGLSLGIGVAISLKKKSEISLSRTFSNPKILMSSFVLWLIILFSFNFSNLSIIRLHNFSFKLSWIIIIKIK